MVDIDITRAAELTPEVEARVDQLMRYAPWDADQARRGGHVRDSIGHAIKALIAHVEPCSARSTAIRKLLEARMDANQAISFRGKL